MTSIIRNANMDDAEDCVKLIYISGPHLFCYLFLKKDPEIYDVFKAIYKIDGTTFSKENVIIEEEYNKIRGIVLGFPISSAGSMEMKLWKCIRNNHGIAYFLKYFLRAMGLLRHNIALAKDEFFITNIAVFDKYRGMGIAVKLLKSMEKSALEQGYKKLSLYVEIDNAHAKSIYEKFGFKEVGKAVFPKKYHKYNILGFYKMVKRIDLN